jgi:RNA polymerase sigma factor (sigma-70 family)
LGPKEYLHRDIIEASKNGNNKARYQLYQLYSRAMFNLCCRMMNNREEAEDMLQEAFTQAFRKLDTFRYDSGFGSWLKRIVVNTCLNTLKKRKPELVYCDTVYQKDMEEEEENEMELTKQRVLNAMKQLPEGGRMVFSLYLLEGYDHAEIAQIMGISESTSKTQFMRAKKRIVEILKSKKSMS